MMINIAGIIPDSIVDGPGIRVVYFCQGCPHHCEGCHNPETWEFGKGIDMDTEQLVAVAKSSPLCKGVTFSGGEPFAQAEGYADLADKLKQDGYEVASYTGYTFEHLLSKGSENQRRLLRKLDVLIDGPFVLSQRTLEAPFRGSFNQRVIDVQKSLQKGEVVLATGRWNAEY